MGGTPLAVTQEDCLVSGKRLIYSEKNPDHTHRSACHIAVHHCNPDIFRHKKTNRNIYLLVTFGRSPKIPCNSTSIGLNLKQIQTMTMILPWDLNGA